MLPLDQLVCCWRWKTIILLLFSAMLSSLTASLTAWEGATPVMLKPEPEPVIIAAGCLSSLLYSRPSFIWKWTELGSNHFGLTALFL